MRFLAPREISRCGLREHLRNRFLELIRDIPVVKEEIAVLILLLAGFRAPCPLMVLRRVIHDKIKAGADSLLMAGTRKVRKVLHRSQFRLHFPVIRDRIAAVAAAGRALQQRHQVKIIHTAFLDIVEMLLHALQILRKALHIHQHAGERSVLIPVRCDLACFIELLQLRAPLLIIAVKHRKKIVKRLLISVIKLAIEPFHLIDALVKSVPELRIPLRHVRHTDTLPCSGKSSGIPLEISLKIYIPG